MLITHMLMWLLCASLPFYIRESGIGLAPVIIAGNEPCTCTSLTRIRCTCDADADADADVMCDGWDVMTIHVPVPPSSVYGLLSAFTLHLLYYLSCRYHVYSLVELCERAFGRAGYVFACTCMFIFNWVRTHVSCTCITGRADLRMFCAVLRIHVIHPCCMFMCCSCRRVATSPLSSCSVRSSQTSSTAGLVPMPVSNVRQFYAWLCVCLHPSHTTNHSHDSRLWRWELSHVSTGGRVHVAICTSTHVCDIRAHMHALVSITLIHMS